MPSTDVIDPAALERLQKWGGPRLLGQMIRLFLENAPERLREVREGFESDELERVERASHGLKSSAANLGATAVTELARRMEEAARDGGKEEARSLLAPLEDAYGRASRRLEAVQAGLSG